MRKFPAVRRAMGAALALATAMLAVGIVGAGPAAGSGSGPDLAVALAAHPAGATAGERMLYRLTVTNVGSHAMAAVTVDVRPAGTFEPAPNDAPASRRACRQKAAGSSDVTCRFDSIPVAGVATGDVVVFAAGPGTATANLTASSPKDNRKANNSASVTTGLRQEGAAAYLPPRASLQAEAVTVKAAARHILVDFDRHEPPTGRCPGGICYFTSAVTVDWPLSTGGYDSNHPDDPVLVGMTFELADVCVGIGTPGCGELRYLGAGATEEVQVLPCPGATPGNKTGTPKMDPGSSSPCWYQKYKPSSGQIHFDVAMGTDDPMFY
jgi:hypothetical protein